MGLAGFDKKQMYVWSILSFCPGDCFLKRTQL